MNRNETLEDKYKQQLNERRTREAEKQKVQQASKNRDGLINLLNALKCFFDHYSFPEINCDIYASREESDSYAAAVNELIQVIHNFDHDLYELILNACNDANDKSTAEEKSKKHNKIPAEILRKDKILREIPHLIDRVKSKLTDSPLNSEESLNQNLEKLYILLINLLPELDRAQDPTESRDLEKRKHNKLVIKQISIIRNILFTGIFNEAHQKIGTDAPKEADKVSNDSEIKQHKEKKTKKKSHHKKQKTSKKKSKHPKEKSVKKTKKHSKVKVHKKAQQIETAADHYINLGMEHLSKGVKDEEDMMAREAFSYALKLEPNDVSALIGYAQSYRYSNHDYKCENDAIPCLNKALTLDPTNVLALNTRALIYMKISRYSYKNNEYHGIALTDYNRVLKLDVNNIEAYSGRASIHAKNGLFSQAIADYTKLIELDPTNGHAYKRRASLYRLQRMYDHAIADYTKIIEIDSQQGLLYKKRGMAYLQQGDYNRAIADFTKYEESDPDSNPSPLSNATDMCFTLKTRKEHNLVKKTCYELDLLKSWSKIDDDEERKETYSENRLFSEFNIQYDRVLKRATKLNTLMRNHGLSFEQAQAYLLVAANNWLVQGQQMIANQVLPIELYIHLTSYFIGLSAKDSEKIIAALNGKLFDDSEDRLLSNYKLRLFSRDEKMDRQQQIVENYQSKLIR